MNDWSSVFVVVLLGDPHAGECGQGSQSGTSSPDGESSVGTGNDLDVDTLGSSLFDFLEKSFSDAFEHGSSSWENDVLVEVSSDIDIALLDWFVGQFLDTVEFFAVHFEGFEQVLGASESGISNGDDFTVWKFVSLLVGRWVLGGLHGLFVVEGNEASFFLDVSDNFELSSGDEVVSSFSEEFGQESG